MKSLSKQILVGMSVVVLIPLLIMTAQGLHCARQAVVELEYAHLQSVLAARRTQLETWMQEREQDLRFACFMSCGNEGCSGLGNHRVPAHFDAVEQYLDLLGLGAPLYESFAIYDREWNLVRHNVDSTHQKTSFQSDRKLIEMLRDESGMVASASHVHADGHIGMHLGYPIREQGAAVTGFLTVNVNVADTLGKILTDRTGLGTSGTLYLLSSSGEYMSRPAEGADLIGLPATIPEDLLKPSMDQVLRYQSFKGDRVLGSSASIPMLNWILVAEVSEAEALTWVSILFRRALWTGLATLAAAFTVAFRFSRSLAKPLRILANTARRVTEGSHHERVSPLEGKEAQEVGQAFNEMLDTLSVTQKKLIQSASLAAMGELSASVVHEMRNPLSSIKINLQALRKKVASDSNYAELASIAQDQTLRLERMLSELLSFGKEIRISPSEVRFQDVIQDALVGIEGKHAQIMVDDGLGDTFLKVDREQFRRVMENLIQNAVEATPEGGRVQINAHMLRKNGRQAEIQVSDEGPGIPTQVMDKIFQPFVTTREHGTGLGLANVKKIVELHGGTVTAANPPTGGALFSVHLPTTTPTA